MRGMGENRDSKGLYTFFIAQVDMWKKRFIFGGEKFFPGDHG